MYRIGHYFSCTGPLSIKHCVNKLELPDFKKCRFHKISHFLFSICKNKPNPPNFTVYKRWCGQVTGQKGGISIIYLSLASHTTKFPYMEAWERDLQEGWDLEEWHKSISRSFKGIFDTSLVEANLKVTTRWYLVPNRLAAIFPSSSPLCFRDCHILSTMIHVWWECLKIRGFWNKMFNLICKVTGHLVPQTPSIALLNGPNDRKPPNIPKNESSLYC